MFCKYAHAQDKDDWRLRIWDNRLIQMYLEKWPLKRCVCIWLH